VDILDFETRGRASMESDSVRAATLRSVEHRTATAVTLGTGGEGKVERRGISGRSGSGSSDADCRRAVT
jgi:hypothetical protein